MTPSLSSCQAYPAIITAITFSAFYIFIILWGSKQLYPLTINMNTIKAKNVIISDINFTNIPIWMTDDEKQLFAETILSLTDQPINKPKRYLEWGSGGSTELISILGTNVNSKFYSIEHATGWCNKMLNETIIQYAINIGKLKYECVDTQQPLIMWGRPAKNANISKMIKYVDRIDMLNENHFDIVLIDGRFRVECAMKLLIGKYIDINSIILVHDYTIREQYYSIDKYYDRINSINTLVLFRVKKNFFENETFMNLAKEDFIVHRLDVDRRMR